MSGRTKEIRTIVNECVKSEPHTVYQNLTKVLKNYSVEELTAYCLAEGEKETLHGYLTQRIIDMAVIRTVWGNAKEEN